MSTDKKDGKLQSAWIWIAFIVFIAGVVLFTVYGMSLGPISGEHAAWASFGSLLAGFFTIAATGATIATLLFLAKQNKDMQKINQAQLEALTFERYINHRKLFFEQLKELEISCKSVFRFRDPSHLYKEIFKDNGPHHCEFSIAPKFDEKGVGLNHVGELFERANELVGRFNCTSFDSGDGDSLAKFLININNRVLMIEPVRTSKEGDLVFNSTRYLINIFSLDEFIDIAFKVSNLILRYTNNPEIDGSNVRADSRFVREAMMTDYYSPIQNFRIKIFKNSNDVMHLVHLYFNVFEMKSAGEGLLLPLSFRALKMVFSSGDSVDALSDNAVFNNVVNTCYAEVMRVKMGVDAGDEQYEKLIGLATILSYLPRR
ncbi:hypothetical protein GHO29_01535 [Pseudomonas helleri]|uniref:Uncharacterized protein n=1 Tax=Pseudomonas helleri TaxID=1608996 RepID=A0A7X1XUC9_9PSED|nr:hypothetical protein [Pseudomonas helleri]MQU25149.1 hypothetical protein [Pseudomonas helleri]